MKQVKDGWHTVAGHNVYVENGKIIRGVEGEDLTRVPVYPYRWMPSANAWSKESMTPDAFRAGIKRETVMMK